MKKVLKVVLILVVAFFVVDFFLSDPSYVPKDEREYTEVTVDELYEELNDNALRAEDTYKDAYVAVTGKLNVIDSEYIGLYPLEYESLDGVHCIFTDDDQREKVKDYSKGDTITVKGKITDVGDVFSYKLTIDSIE